MLLISLFQVLIVILIVFEKTDHLKIWQHIRMLFHKKGLERTIRSYWYKQHLKVCECFFCFILIRFKYASVVSCLSTHFELEVYHNGKHGYVSQNYDQVGDHISVRDNPRNRVAPITVIVLGHKECCELWEGGKEPNSNYCDSLFLYECFVVHFSYLIHHPN